MNIVLMECYYKSNSIGETGVSFKGYSQIMYKEWLEQIPFGDVAEQRICDWVRTTRKMDG